MKFCLKCMKSYDDKYDKCPSCGHMASSSVSVAIRPGTIIKERYVIGDVLGKGGFGITYEGWDILLRQKIAIKEYFPSSFATRAEDGFTSVPLSKRTERSYRIGREKFLEEARLIANINQAEEIVHVYDYLELNNTAYIIMEFISGKTLLDEFKARGEAPMSADATIETLGELVAALSKVHKSGIIHRDISPDNIIITDDGSVKLIDFGAARAYIAGQDKALTTILKVDYAPPEQFGRETKQDERTDIYALGAVFYRLLTGEKPQRSVDRLVNDDMQDASRVDKKIPKWLSDVIAKCMSLDPNERYSNADELLMDLRTKGSQNERVTRRRNKIIKIAVALLVIVVATVIGVIYDVKENAINTILTPSGNEVYCEDGIIVEDFGWNYDERTGDVNCVILAKMDENYSKYDASVQVDAYDKNGEKIGTAQCTDSGLFSYGIHYDTSVYNNFTFPEMCETRPDKLCLTTRLAAAFYEEDRDLLVKEHGYKNPTVSNLHKNEEGRYEFYVTNNNTYPANGFGICVVFRDDEGNLIGGATPSSYSTYDFDSLEQGETGRFSIEIAKELSKDIEVFVLALD